MLPVAVLLLAEMLLLAALLVLEVVVVVAEATLATKRAKVANPRIFFM